MQNIRTIYIKATSVLIKVKCGICRTRWLIERQTRSYVEKGVSLLTTVNAKHWREGEVIYLLLILYVKIEFEISFSFWWRKLDSLAWCYNYWIFCRWYSMRGILFYERYVIVWGGMLFYERYVIPETYRMYKSFIYVFITGLYYFNTLLST